MPKDLKDFEKLQEERPAVAKTSNEDLLKFLSEAMRTTKWPEVRKAWLAGLFDGEGHCGFIYRTVPGTQHDQWIPIAGISQPSQPEILQFLQKSFGYGTVVENRQYVVRHCKAVRMFFEAFMDYVVLKRPIMEITYDFAWKRERNPHPYTTEELLLLAEGYLYNARNPNCKGVERLVERLSQVKEVASFLSVENGTAFSRLRRLKKAGIVTRRWDGQRSWWVARKAVGLPELPPEVPETTEE
jgi:hypothetical protein